MSECNICQIIKEKKNMIYEDKECFAYLKEKPATAGHIVIVPKKHYQIIEQVPDPLVAKMFNIANKFSIIIFETLKAGGTNIIIQNGIPAGQKNNHFSINVIARRDGDGLNFQWPMKELSADELSTTKLILEKETKNIIPKEGEKEKIEEVKTVSAEEIKDDYLTKQLNRLP